MRNARETDKVEWSAAATKPMERMGIRARNYNNLLLNSSEEEDKDKDAKWTSGQKGTLIATRDRKLLTNSWLGSS